MYGAIYLCDMWTVLFVSHVFSKLNGKVKRLQIVSVIYTLKTKQTKTQSEKSILQGILTNQCISLYTLGHWETTLVNANGTGFRDNRHQFNTCTR